MSYQDGTFTTAVQNGPAQFFYPFINAATKDNVTKGTIRNYVVLPANYTPATALSTDVNDNTQYLINESELTIEGGVARFSRTYCKIPAQQVNFSTLAINKPAFPTNDYNGAWADCTADSVTANVWDQALAATVSRYPTGGTFTVTYKTNTTAALNYNDSDVTIATAVNGLASVIADNFTVAATNQITSGGSLNLTDNGGGGTPQGSDFSCNIAGLTPTCVQEQQSVFGAVTFRIARALINFNRTSHGLNANTAIRVLSSNTGGGTLTSVSTVVGPNDFTIANASGTPPAYTHYRELLRTYTPGTDRVVVKEISNFYLPGITPNVTTPADIPVPDVAINDAQLLALITTSATGFQNYDAEPLRGWPTDSSPIYVQTLQQINVDNL